MFEPQRDVGILGGVFRNSIGRHHVHRDRARSAADECRDGDRVVAQEGARQVIHAVARLGVEQVVEQHRVVLAAFYRHTRRGHEFVVELYVLADLGYAFVFEQGFYYCHVCRPVFGGERHPPRAARSGGERDAYHAVAVAVVARGFGVVGEFGELFEFRDDLLQLLSGGDCAVVVGRGGDVVECWGGGEEVGCGGFLLGRWGEEVALACESGFFGMTYSPIGLGRRRHCEGFRPKQSSRLILDCFALGGSQ